MLELNVGDVFKRRHQAHPQWKVTEIGTLSDGAVRVSLVVDSGGKSCECDQGYHCIHSTGFHIVEVANPNLITVSSLDYLDSTTLTDEDKLIIMEHLEHA